MLRIALLAGSLALLAPGGPLSAVPISAQVREQRPNVVGGELLGRGLLLSLNYERFFTNTLGIGGGFMAVGFENEFIGVLPLYASVALGDVHAFYMGAGVTYVFGEGSSGSDFDSEALGTISLGYQFQSYGGFLIRPLFTYFRADGEALLWPGITIGASF